MLIFWKVKWFLFWPLITKETRKKQKSYHCLDALWEVSLPGRLHAFQLHIWEWIQRWDVPVNKGRMQVTLLRGIERMKNYFFFFNLDFRFETYSLFIMNFKDSSCSSMNLSNTCFLSLSLTWECHLFYPHLCYRTENHLLSLQIHVIKLFSPTLSVYSLVTLLSTTAYCLPLDFYQWWVQATEEVIFYKQIVFQIISNFRAAFH